jgi:signal transduction histidine kinase
MDANIESETVLTAQVADFILELGQSLPFCAEGGFLSRIASLCRADGVVLWLPMQGTKENHRLFSAASWFRNEKKKFFRYLAEDSLTYRQALAGAPGNFSFPYPPDGADTSDAEASEKIGIRTLCSIPVQWADSPWVEAGAMTGLVSFYRLRDMPFSQEAFENAKLAARLVLPLLSDLANRSTFDLLRSVSSELSLRSESQVEPERFWRSIRSRLNSVAHLVANAFACLEVSIYLEHPGRAGKELKRMAGLWPWKIPPREVYPAGFGLTGGCYLHAYEMQIFDLRRFEEDREVIQERYPNVDWAESIHVAEPIEGQEWFEDTPPPMSFIAAPIRHGDRTYGVVRCSVLRTVPYYFGADRLRALSLLGSHIGEWFAGELRLNDSFEERHWLRDYVESVAHLNVKAHQAQLGLQGDHSFLVGALESIRKALPGSLSSWIRIAEEGALHCRASGPEAEASKGGAIEELRGPLPLKPSTGTKLSLAAEVYNTGKARRVNDLEASSFPRLSADTNALIVCPISSGAKKYGTIEVRFRAGSDISDHAESALSLLGSQVGLYLFLADRIEELRKEKDLRANEARVQRETFENMGHQLKTPIAHARGIALLLDRRLKKMGQMRKEREALVTYLRQAAQVAWNIKMFGDLAARRPIRLEREVLTGETLRAKISAAMEAASVRRPQDIKFVLETDDGDVVTRNTILVDLGLLDQMLDNLLDNAVKYAFAQSIVVVSTGTTHEGKFFYISVANKGIEVPSSLAKRLMQRGERSHLAVAGGGEGSGLGLYLVNEILNAHGGHLEVIPTDHRGVVRFRLLIPISQKGSSDAMLNR